MSDGIYDRQAQSAPQSDNPPTEEPRTDFPSAENPQLLNTDIQNTNGQNTDSTKSVSELDVTETIRGIFGGEYPFDKNFARDLLQQLSGKQIDSSQLRDYLCYVFEQTRKANPKKSFAGYYRKLALEQTVLAAFKLQRAGQPENGTKTWQKEMMPEKCPVCGEMLGPLDYCLKCGLPMIERNNNAVVGQYRRMQQMSLKQKQEYEKEYRVFREKILEEKGMPFFLSAEGRDIEARFINELAQKYELAN